MRYSARQLWQFAYISAHYISAHQESFFPDNTTVPAQSNRHALMMFPCKRQECLPSVPVNQAGMLR